MKFLKLSLAASVALGALSTASFAQPLEEAIKGVDVSGYLRYRYNDDRYDNSTGNATHQWKAVANFKTPTVNNVALNLGILYHNNTQNVNHSKNANGTGGGLGAGKDSEFGVNSLYAIITPDSTATTVLIGKQKLDTPVTNADDGDRGTGILALNSDIPGLTLAAGAFDAWALDDLNLTTAANGGSVAKPLYTLAAIYGTDTSIGNIGFQLWGFMVDDLVDSLIFSELSWKHSLFNAKLQYGYSKLDNSEGALAAGVADTNDLLSLQVGANFKQDFNIPLDLKLGYITNFQDGTTVSFDDEGAFAKAGKIWWQNTATDITIGAGRALNGAYGVTTDAQEREINVFYGAVSYGLVDDRLRLGLEAVFGENEVTTTANGVTTTVTKREFTEITPTVSWKHSKNLTISGFYAMLNTKYKEPNANTPDEDRNRARVEVKYAF